MASAQPLDSALLDAALAYASKGVPVFPCNEAKRPYTEHGFKEASTDAETIRSWWRKWPNAMIGAPTGKPIGAWVLDVDDPGAFDGACADLGLVLPATRTAITGKGRHLYFKLNGEAISNAQRTKKGWPFPELPGAEVRGDGGYIIMPPSLHPSGRRYEWQRDELSSEAPDDLLRIVRKVGKSAEAAPPPAADSAAPHNPFIRDTPYGLAALEAECAAIRSAPTGAQEVTLNEAALKIGALVAGGELLRETAMGQLVAAGLCLSSANPDDPWTPQGIAAKVDRSLRDGMRTPRSAPDGGREASAQREAVAPANDDAPDISATPYVWREPHTIPMREWVFGRWLLRGTATAVIAPGGVGKTTLLAGISLSLATGRPFLGKSVWGEAKGVWLWNLEDDLNELSRAIQAGAKHHGIKPADLGDRLYVDSGMDGSELCTAVEDAAGFRLLQPVYEGITAELIRRNISVLILDPFVSTHAVEENSNTLIDKIAKAWGRVAKAANCAIVLVHHTSKAGSGEVTALSGRGAVALVNACRQALVLNRMDKDTAERLGIPEDQHRRYFSVQDDKANRAPAEKADWYHLASVDLGNGPENDLGHGDSIGVAEPWAIPDPFANITPQHLLQVQCRISEGEWRKDYQAKAWAGHAVADVLGLNAADKADRARIRKLLDTWIREGALVVTERKDEQRRPREWIEVGRWQNDQSAPPQNGGAAQGGAVERPACSTTTPTISGGWSGAERGRVEMVEQKSGGAWHDNPSLGRKRPAERLAPGETGDEPVPGFEGFGR